MFFFETGLPVFQVNYKQAKATGVWFDAVSAGHLTYFQIISFVKINIIHPNILVNHPNIGITCVNILINHQNMSINHLT